MHLTQMEREQKQKLTPKTRPRPMTTKNTSSTSNSPVTQDELLRAISAWDYMQVESTMKKIVSRDQSKFWESVSDSLHSLEDKLASYSKMKQDVIDSVSNLNSLLSHLSWKDYFVKWFHEVSFELDDLNLTALESALGHLENVFSDDNGKEIIKAIKSYISRREASEVNTSNSDISETSSQSDVKDIIPESDSPFNEESIQIENEDTTTIESESESKKEFDIKSAFWWDVQTWEPDNKNEDAADEINDTDKEDIRSIIEDEKEDDLPQDDNTTQEDNYYKEDAEDQKIDTAEKSVPDTSSNFSNFEWFDTVEDFDFEDEEDDLPQDDNTTQEDRSWAFKVSM